MKHLSALLLSVALVCAGCQPETLDDPSSLVLSEGKALTAQPSAPVKLLAGWASAASMASAHLGPIIVVLNTGKVLVAGGSNSGGTTAIA